MPTVRVRDKAKRSDSRNATCVASGMQQAVSKRVRCKN